jgi:hypothetical protein
MSEIKRRSKTIINRLIPQIIHNVGNTKYNQRALFSYSTRHFLFKKYGYHPSYLESRLICSELNKMGFNIDVINNTCEKDLDYKKYDLIFGEGVPLYNSLKYPVRSRIYYATGSHPSHCSIGSIKRLRDFYQRTGFLADKSIRTFDTRWGIAADLTREKIVIGNDHTASTFQGSKNSNHSIKTIYPTIQMPEMTKNINMLNNDFLFIGSYSLLHKGLDLYVDAARKFPNYNFRVLARTSEESHFVNKLDLPQNVILDGFYPTDSPEFLYILKKCRYVVLPSISEGMATSVLTGIIGGKLLPIITKECGIDMTDNVVPVAEHTVESLEKSISCALQMSKIQIKNSVEALSVYYRERCSIEYFQAQIRTNLERIAS